MQRKPGFPVSNCSIKVPDNVPVESPDEDGEQQQRRQLLINFGHAQWGFNNWNWAVTKQELDFVEQSNGKYCAGVVAFVSITVKTIDIQRENIGYATSSANNKGFAIYKSRKVAVTNALRETLLSFGGSVATELTELLESTKEAINEPLSENNQNITNTTTANTNIANTKIANTNIANTNLSNTHLTNIVNPSLANTKLANANHANPNHVSVNHANVNLVNANIAGASITKPLLEGPPLVKNVRNNSVDKGPANVPSAPVKNAAPVAKAHPMPAQPAPRVPANPRPAPVMQPVHPRPNSNEPAKFEGMTEEEARAERKRRQRQAQEEFRLKQLVKQDPLDLNHDRNSNSLDKLLLAIPTQDIVIEETGSSNKRKSPTPGEACAKRRASISRLDILHD